jgi:ABC-type transport system involved in multi-copper enzyme maturation permease subunit
MSALIAAELLKLRLTRATWGFVAAAVVLAAVRTAMVVLSAGTAAGVSRGTTAATTTLIGAAGLGTVVFMLLGATAMAGEFQHATITATLLNTPHRRAVVMAKFIAYAIAGAVVSGALVAGALAVALATGLAGPMQAAVLHAAAATIVGGVFLTSLGVGVGLLIHNQTVALATPLVWLVIAEPLTRSFGLTFLTPWLPGTLPGELGPSTPAGSLAPAVAAAVLAGYVTTLGALGARRLRRADIG